MPNCRLALRILKLVFLVFVSATAAAEKIHQIESPFQPGNLDIRVLLPDHLEAGKTYPVVYVLPVEAQAGTRWGDPVAEVRKNDLQNSYGVICVFPQFAQLPWYADHPTDPAIRQESYFLKSVLPLIEQTYPVLPGRPGRLLIGFSKSGFGAWSLLLRHPDLFEGAAAFDAPLMQETPNKYGMGPIFGTQENFDRYCIPPLLKKRAEELRGPSRLVLIGAGNFEREHTQMHALLNELQVAHKYVAGPGREHSWGSGWLPQAFELLSAVSRNDGH